MYINWEDVFLKFNNDFKFNIQEEKTLTEEEKKSIALFHLNFSYDKDKGFSKRENLSKKEKDFIDKL